MRRTRAVAITALAAVTALVLSACSDSGQAGAPSTTAAPSATSSPATSDGGGSTPATSGTESAGTGSSEAGPSSSGGGDTPASGACGTPHGPYAEPATTGGSAKVAWNQPLYSWNNATGHGNAVANTNPRYLANTGFFSYDGDLNLVNNDSFGTCELVSEDPLTIKYTINKDVKWSDGVPVTAADLLLAWASNSQQFNTGELKTDDNGTPLPNQSGIAFDAGSPAMALVTDFPTVGDDGQSLTIKYDEFFVDYPFQLDVGVPAHVVAMKGLGLDDATAATDKMLSDFEAFHKDATVTEGVADDSKVDKTVVADVKKMVDFWNTGFDFTELPSDKALYLSNGAYLLTEFKKDEYMTFTRNPDYTWGPKPVLDTITYRIYPDAMTSVQALQNGEVDMTNPQATADVLGAVQALSGQGVKTITGDGATYEHVDLAVNNKGPFDPATYGGDAEKAKKVRQAFLKTIPRQDIVNKLIKPLNPEAVLRESFNIVPGAPGYDEVAASNGMKNYDTPDIEGAKALLAEAGVTTPVSVRFMYADANARRANEYALISASATQAGFTVVDGKNKDWGAQLSNTKIYDAALFGWQSTAVGWSQVAPNFETGGQNNFYGYSNKEVDSTLKQLNAEKDSAKQLELNAKVEKALVDDAFGVTIFQFPEIVAYNSTKLGNVKNLSLSPGVFWNFYEWTPGE